MGGKPEDIHIVPLRDVADHYCNLQCLCRPTVEDLGPRTPRVVTHNSYDGREYFEPEGPRVQERPN